MVFIFTGSQESYEIYEEYITRGVSFECLQFVSETIKAIESTHRQIHHIYIPGLGKTKSKSKIKKQDQLMAMATVGFAKGNNSKTIVVSCKVSSDLDELSAVNNIIIICPFINES